MTRAPCASGLSETAKGHAPMPANAGALWARCLFEAHRRVSIRDVWNAAYLAAGVRAWATMALATAISAKHASALLRRNRNYAAMVRCQYVRFAEAADAFGAGLVPEWVEDEAAA